MRQRVTLCEIEGASASPEAPCLDQFYGAYVENFNRLNRARAGVDPSPKAYEQPPPNEKQTWLTFEMAVLKSAAYGAHQLVTERADEVRPLRRVERHRQGAAVGADGASLVARGEEQGQGTGRHDHED